MNNTNLIGRITKDLELKKSKIDTPFVTFTLACKRKQANNEGEKLTDFFNCVAFGPRATYLANNACKSTLISIEGRLQSKIYYDKLDNRHSTVDIICESVQILRQPDEKVTITINDNLTSDLSNEHNNSLDNLNNNEDDKDNQIEEIISKYNQEIDSSIDDKKIDDSQDDDIDKMINNFSTLFED